MNVSWCGSLGDPEVFEIEYRELFRRLNIDITTITAFNFKSFLSIINTKV